METATLRGCTYPVLTGRRIGHDVVVKCPHCTAVAGAPVHHEHSTYPNWEGHVFKAGCADPASPLRKTGYIVKLELPPVTEEELAARIDGVLADRSPVPLTEEQRWELLEELRCALKRVCPTELDLTMQRYRADTEGWTKEDLFCRRCGHPVRPDWRGRRVSSDPAFGGQ